MTQVQNVAKWQVEVEESSDSNSVVIFLSHVANKLVSGVNGIENP